MSRRSRKKAEAKAESPAPLPASPKLEGKLPEESQLITGSNVALDLPKGAVRAAAQVWIRAYRIELMLFFFCFAAYASFSSFRFLRQSEAPHFIYQAQAWLEGRLDIDPSILPNLEDWACVREEITSSGSGKVRCSYPPRNTDRWYVSFPPFPALLMLPFVALQGYQLNDTSFTVILGALAVAFFFSLLRLLSKVGDVGRDEWENTILSLTLGFGTLLFYCSIRGEVWFTAEVLGVALTALYLRNSIRARRPALAGLFFSMAALTRTPLLFTGLFFLLECFCPEQGGRIEQLQANLKSPSARRKLWAFALGAAPLFVACAWFNAYRFGSPFEFGHRFLFNNRVNADIDQHGLFSLHYLARNLTSAFLLLPRISLSPLRLDYDPNGLSILLTFPPVVFLMFPKERRRLHWPLWLTVAVCALPGLLYQNNGYMQFGFRFALDYLPYLLLLFAIGGWSVRRKEVAGALGLGALVNFWGAVAFKGYTEWVRHW